MRSHLRAVFAIASALLEISSPANAADVEISLKSHGFSPAEITVPAGEAITLTVRNLDATPAEFESKELRVEKVIAGNSSIVVKLRPLKPGRYAFFDEYHEDLAKGTLVAK
jgi:plastocyanin